MKVLYNMYKKAWKLHAFFTFCFLSVFTVSAQEVWTENFDYTFGDALTDHGWIANVSGAPLVVTSGLSFDGYTGSGIGGGAQLEGDGEAAYTRFPKVTSGSVYAAFLVQINGEGGANGQYFLHLWDGELPTWLGGTVNKFDYNARVYCSADGKNIGLAFSDNTYSVYTTSDFINKYQTYLMVLKYEIVPGDKNDKVSLYVFDSMPSGAEPAKPTLGPIVSTAADKADIFPAGIGLRQGHPSIDIVVDGIRVATSWEAAVQGTGTALNKTTRDNAKVWLSANNRILVSSPVAGEVLVYDITGKLVTSQYCNAGQTILDVKPDTGIYLVRVSEILSPKVCIIF